jgi:hypothetical protein
MMAARRVGALVRPQPIATSFHQRPSRHSAVKRSMALSNDSFTRPSPFAYVRVEDALLGIRIPFPKLAPEPMKPLAAVAITACRVAPSGAVQWLMIKRGKAPSRGDWSLPGTEMIALNISMVLLTKSCKGGSMELGETPWPLQNENYCSTRPT